MSTVASELRQTLELVSRAPMRVAATGSKHQLTLEWLYSNGYAQWENVDRVTKEWTLTEAGKAFSRNFLLG